MADLNLKNAQEQIKAFEELARRYNNIIESEKRLNQTILYSTRNRKKYKDALTAVSSAHEDLLHREEQLASSVKSVQTRLRSNISAYHKLKGEEEDVIDAQNKLAKVNKKTTDEYKALEKKLKKLRSSMAGNLKETKGLKSELKGFAKEIDVIKEGTDDLRETYEKIEKLDLSNVKDVEDYAKKRLNIMKDQYDILEKKGILTRNETDELKKQLDTAEALSEEAGKQLEKRVSKEARPMAKRVMEGAAEAGGIGKSAEKELFSVRSRQLKGALGTLRPGSSFSSIISSAKAGKEAGKDIGYLKETMAASGKGALKASKNITMLGTALKGIGKLGWIGLVLKLVVTLGKAVSDLDKFLKSFNQTFAKLHGPTVMMGNIDKEMDAFTDSIFNLQRNLKLGLKSEDIVGMFQAVAESGMSLQGILSKVSGGYNALIEKTARVHLDFGVSMEEAGGMLGEMMNDLRYSVEEASDSFKVLSYDASLAGIQSQRFYQATYAAAEALSYYGKFVNAASNSLKDFQVQGAMGFKDAQKEATTMTNLFKDMDNNQRLAFVNMSGGVEKYRKMFEKKEEELGNKVSEHLDKIKGYREKLVTAHTDEEINELKQLINAEEENMKVTRRQQKTANLAAKSNAQDMVMYLELLSDQVSENLGDLFKSMQAGGAPDIARGGRDFVEFMKSAFGFSEDFAKTMIGTFQASAALTKDIVKGLSDIFPEGGEKGLGGEVKEIIKDAIDGDRIDMGEIKDNLRLYTNMSKDQVDVLMKFLDESSGAVLSFFEEGADKTLKNMGFLDYKKMEKVAGGKEDDQVKRLDDLVKNTHTIEDFIGINKENAKYFIAGSKPQKVMAQAAIATARNTGTILGFVKDIVRGTKETQTAEEFRESKGYKKLENLLTREMILQYRKSEAKTEKERESINKELEKVDELKRKVAKSNIYLEDELREPALKRAKEVMAKQKEASEDYQQALSMMTKSTREKGRYFREGQSIKSQYRKQYGEYMPFSAESVTVESVKANKDYKAKTGGYALLSKGDVVVNAKNMSTGLGGDIGAFAGTVSSDISKGIGMLGKAYGAVAPTIPVQISIGSINGDAEDFLKRIKPAIEQAFERMYYDKQKRR